VNREVTKNNVRHLAEEALLPLIANRSDYVFGRHTGAIPHNIMQTAQFCLSLHGVGGGFAQRDFMGMLEGCLPVFGLSNTSFVYDELFPPASYGLIVDQNRLHVLPAMLDEMRPAQIRHLRHQAAKVCRSFLPPAEGDEKALDSDGNSFSSIWRILGARLVRAS
jgi:hypothetical protein